ncbi:hypothetical protein R5W24_003643 [Gemmata sp. JC717]|uniref:hypothetical protein n=1 Tax=Gemmata algarum TaxID=2975278 RepID=UPI0021BB3F41|nr:hypothetical protein [Gemmata algarum]MDY3554519.1 hypothetical protein [Gemmata algarum]
MTLETAPTGRAYPYWSGWHMVGCSVLFFGLFGTFAVSLFPAGYDRVRTGDLPTGVAMMVFGVFGAPTLGMAIWSLVMGVRNTFRPPLLRLTADALVLPAEARGEPPRGEHGELLSQEPPQPEAVPLNAIRTVATNGGGHKRGLEVVHALSAQPLRIEAHMMSASDFNDLVARLQTAVPTAFAPAPTRSGG